MSNKQYNLQFDKLCKFLQLGNMVGEPEVVTGGLMHRMYAINTTKGKYAVKALNPQIMLRPVAMGHIINSERIANVAINNIPALSSIRCNDNFIHEIDEQHYLVFDWIDGKSLKLDEIKTEHCKKIGTILAKLHMTDFNELDIVNHNDKVKNQIDWDYFLMKGQENNSKWVNLIQENIKELHMWNQAAIKSAKNLSSNMVISHRDLDPKNVMWNNEEPIVIDWESADYTNPMHELVETAIYWAETENSEIDKEKFVAFMNGYRNIYGVLEADWREVLLNGFIGKLEWLEYSLKRSLGIECTDEKEQLLGTTQVFGTINSLKRYNDMIPKLESWL